MSRSRQLTVATTWDGRPLPEAAVVHVQLHLDAVGLSISVDAPLYDDPLPLDGPGPTWGLWDYEVVEVFLCGPNERYTEVEIGPQGHFLVLRLEGKRQVVGQVEDLELSVVRSGGRWRATARLSAEHLPPGPYTLNAYAISGAGEGRRYSAAYPRQGDGPDFHALEAFKPW
jgi:hypothetical protein